MVPRLRQKHDASAFAGNQALCLEAKRAKDNLCAQAKRQGNEDWFRKIEFDDKRFSHLLAAYCARKQMSAARSKFSFAQYKKNFEAAQEIFLDDEGVTMSEESYYDWATKESQAKLSMKQAQANWASWTAQLEETRSRSYMIGKDRRD